MNRTRTVIKILAEGLFYSSIVILIDLLIIFFIQGGFNEVLDVLSFILLLEGGIGLVVGGASVSYVPLGAKISEALFHSKPWSADRQRETEKQAILWIITGVFLVFEALILSVV